MKFQHEYKIWPEYKLNIQVYKGLVNLNGIFASMVEVVKDEKYHESYNIIADFRNAILKFEEEEIQRFIRFLQRQNIKDVPRRVALFTDTPNQDKFIAIFSQFANGPVNINYRIFSTLGAVIEFVGFPAKKVNSIETEINILREKMDV